MLGELVACHTKVAIYPAYEICLQKVVIHALPQYQVRADVGNELPD